MKTKKKSYSEQHPEIWDTPCPICGEKFVKRGLNSHISRVHKKRTEEWDIEKKTKKAVVDTNYEFHGYKYTKPTKKKTEEWEKEFNSSFYLIGIDKNKHYHIYDDQDNRWKHGLKDIESFIRYLLKKQSEERIKMWEGMKKDVPKQIDIDKMTLTLSNLEIIHNAVEFHAYNQAITDIIAKERGKI